MGQDAKPARGTMGVSSQGKIPQPIVSRPWIDHVYLHYSAMFIEYDFSDKSAATLLEIPIPASPARVERLPTLLDYLVFTIPLMYIFIPTFQMCCRRNLP